MGKQDFSNDYDYGYGKLKDMQHWAGNQKFHDNVDKRLADIRKKREEKNKKNSDFSNGKKNWCGKKPDSVKMNESQLREMVSKIIRESLSAAKPWVNDTGYQVGNWDDREVKKWNNAYNKPNDSFAQGTEEFTNDLDNRKDYWDATVKDFRNAIQSDPKLKKEISDMIKNGEYSGFDDEELISDWADAHLWGRPNPNSEYWKFRKGIETGGMETAKEIGDIYRNEYYKDDSEDELWHAHDANDKKDFERLSSPMSESQFREIVSKVIRESLEEIDFQNPNWSDDYFNSLTDVDGYEDEDTFGDELETIRGAIEAIKGKLAGGNLANADEQSTAFVQSKISEMENILNELMSGDSY